MQIKESTAGGDFSEDVGKDVYSFYLGYKQYPHLLSKLNGTVTDNVQYTLARSGVRNATNYTHFASQVIAAGALLRGF